MGPDRSSPIFDAVPAQGVISAMGNEPNGYIADLVLPKIGGPLIDLNGQRVENVPANGLLRLLTGSWGQAGLRTRVGAGEKTPLIRHLSSTEIEYAVQPHKAAIALTEFDRDRLRTNAGINAQAVTLKPLYDTMMIDHEADVAALFSAAGNWTSPLTLVGGACWSEATSTPLTDIRRQKELIERFHEPNVIIMGRATANTLIDNPDFKQWIGVNNDRGILTIPEMTERLKSRIPGIEHVFIGKTAMNTALVPGAETLVDCWGDMFWMGYIPMLPTGKPARLGYFDAAELNVTNPTATMLESSAVWSVDRFGLQYDEFGGPQTDEQTTYLRLSRNNAFGVMRAQYGTLILNTVL